MNTEFPFPILRESTFKFEEIWKVCGLYVVYNVISDCRYVGRANWRGSRFRDHYEWLRKRKVDKLNERMLWDLDRLGKGVTPYRFAILEQCDRKDCPAVETRWIHEIRANYNMVGFYPMPEPFPSLAQYEAQKSYAK